MCQFSHLSVGSELDFHSRNGWCEDCGYAEPTRISRVRYIGHGTINGHFGDVFKYLETVNCLGCGHNFTHTICWCEDYTLDIGIKAEWPVPQELEVEWVKPETKVHESEVI